MSITLAFLELCLLKYIEVHFLKCAIDIGQTGKKDFYSFFKKNLEPVGFYAHGHFGEH